MMTRLSTQATTRYFGLLREPCLCYVDQSTVTYMYVHVVQVHSMRVVDGQVLPYDVLCTMYYVLVPRASCLVHSTRSA